MPFADVPSNEQIATLVLPWAKAEHPDWYEKTLKVASRPAAFRDYLIRLVERRCESDRAWSNSIPLMVLEETRVTRRVKDNETGIVMDVKGMKAGPRVWTFKQLTLEREEFRQLRDATLQLDLAWHE